MSDDSLPSLMHKAEETSGLFHNLATKVSTSVDEVDQWLSSLPGKIAVESHTANPSHHPDFHDWPILVVGFRRINKDWCLAYAEAEESPHPDFAYDPPTQWKRVREASLRVKAAALRLVPELIEAFHSEQRSLITAMSDIPDLELGKKGGI